jgi:phosphoserine aminotransferase
MNQTYNTPALATLFLLDRQISATLAEGGLDVAALRSHRSSQHLYSWAEARPFAAPFVEDPQFRSPTVVTIDFDQSVAAMDIAGVLREHGVVDIEGYRKLGRNQLRIATFPNVPTTDVVALTACIDYVVESM